MLFKKIFISFDSKRSWGLFDVAKDVFCHFLFSRKIRNKFFTGTPTFFSRMACANNSASFSYGYDGIKILCILLSFALHFFCLRLNVGCCTSVSECSALRVCFCMVEVLTWHQFLTTSWKFRQFHERWVKSQQIHGVNKFDTKMFCKSQMAFHFNRYWHWTPHSCDLILEFLIYFWPSEIKCPRSSDLILEF